MPSTRCATNAAKCIDAAKIWVLNKNRLEKFGKLGDNGPLMVESNQRFLEKTQPAPLPGSPQQERVKADNEKNDLQKVAKELHWLEKLNLGGQALPGIVGTAYGAQRIGQRIAAARSPGLPVDDYSVDGPDLPPPSTKIGSGIAKPVTVRSRSATAVTAAWDFKFNVADMRCQDVGKAGVWGRLERRK